MDITYDRRFGCAEPLGRKKNFAVNSKLLFTAASGIACPTKVTFENCIDKVHNQPTGTCFAEAATTLAESWLWMKTGKKYEFTQKEIWDIAADSKGSSYELRESNQSKATDYGFPGPALRSIYEYNSNLSLHYFTDQKECEACKVFKQLVDRDLGGFSIQVVNYVSNADFKAKMKQCIFENGVVCVSIYWYKTSVGHSIVACKYDDDYIYLRNSWGSKTLAKWTWDDFCNSSMAKRWGSGYEYDVCLKNQMRNM